MGTIFSYRFHRLCHTLQLHFLHLNDVSAQEEHVCSACERAFTTSAHLAALAPHSRVRKVPQMSVPWLRNTVLVSGICMCPFSCHLCPCRIFSCLYSSYKTPAPATNSLLRRSSTPSLNSMVHQPSPRPHPQLLRLHLHRHQHHHLHLHLPAHIYVHHAFVHFLRQLLWFLSVLSIH